MIAINRKYSKKSNKNVVVIPFSIIGTTVTYHEDSYLDRRFLDKRLFVERFVKL